MQDLPVRKQAHSAIRDMFDNGKRAVQYQAFVQFVEVTRKVNWSEAPGMTRDSMLKSSRQKRMQQHCEEIQR